jgi:dipeptidyl aminopeptidase/acylaminoacyl peptidase
VTFESGDDMPRWSPDGRHIAYIGFDEISIVESDGGSPNEVTVPGLFLQEPVWSPDGRQIALEGDLDFPHLRVLDVDSGRITTVAPKLRVDYTRPAWSPDGARLALRVQDETYVVQVPPGAVRRVMVDAGHPDEHSDPFGDPDDGSNVSWSPDGTWLAVPANGDLWIVRADGTGKRRVLAAGYGSSIEDVQWHPGALRSAALGGEPASARAPVVHVTALGDTWGACGIELWRPEGSRWLVAGEGNTARAYAKPLRPGVWQILDGGRDVLGQAVATNTKRTRWNITDARGTLVGTAQSAEGPWIALVLLWGGADCLD